MDLNDVKYVFAIHKSLEERQLMTPGISEAILNPIKLWVVMIGPSQGVLQMLLREGAPDPIRLFLEKQSFNRSIDLPEMLEALACLYERSNSGFQPEIIAAATQAKKIAEKYSRQEVYKSIKRLPVYTQKWLKKQFRDLF